jgi:hypothetical protein
MKKFLLFVVIASAALVWGCTEGIEEVKETIQSAEDNALMETEFSALFDVMDDEASTNEKLGKTGGTILPSSATLTFTDDKFDDGDGVEFSIDFGGLGSSAPFGVLCQDGKYRAGVVNASLSKPYSEIGAVLTITLNENDSFFAGNGARMSQLIGVLTVTRKSVDEVEVDLNGGMLKTDQGKQMELSYTRLIERIKDSGPGIWKDEFLITGSGNGVNVNGEAFTVNIDEALKKIVDAGCSKTFVKGVVSLKLTDSDKQITIDYDPFDNEACDNVVEADVNGKKTTFTVN